MFDEWNFDVVSFCVGLCSCAAYHNCSSGNNLMGIFWILIAALVVGLRKLFYIISSIEQEPEDEEK